MLVLSRKVGESFLIGDLITVTVVRIAGGGVRLGIEAPVEYTVVRSELVGASEGSLPVHEAPRPNTGSAST
jgi:carbon storage regulator CsrA